MTESQNVEQKEKTARESAERKPLTKEKISAKLRLFHATPDYTGELLKQMENSGGILSSKKMSERGIADPGGQTYDTDREIGNDYYVFLSPLKRPYGIGGRWLEVEKTILNKPGTLVSTAGDYLVFKGLDDTYSTSIFTDYYYQSRIPGHEFLDYLVGFVNKLPNPNWFFSQRSRDSKEFREFQTMAREELKRPWRENPWSNYKMYLALDPEIMVLDEIPTSYIKGISGTPNPASAYSSDKGW